MAAVLGIDAAWTTTNPSGVALVALVGERWRCVALAPSYAWCGTHSPSATRPDAVGGDLKTGFTVLGYPRVDRLPLAVVEVYPHPALLTLMGATERLPYKLSKPERTWATLRPVWGGDPHGARDADGRCWAPAPRRSLANTAVDVADQGGGGIRSTRSYAPG